ncbi:uncharacterized protein [Panulirus ornatus]|uniref:uncharacterized protein n=1 Tax=Panulirus ornatus TaxID=150431 RepID=UPI003A884A71
MDQLIVVPLRHGCRCRSRSRSSHGGKTGPQIESDPHSCRECRWLRELKTVALGLDEVATLHLSLPPAVSLRPVSSTPTVPSVPVYLPFTLYQEETPEPDKAAQYFPTFFPAPLPSPGPRPLSGYYCSMCSEVVDRNTFSQHLKDHARNKVPTRHYCSICKKYYSSYISLNKHFRKLHPSKPVPKPVEPQKEHIEPSQPSPSSDYGSLSPVSLSEPTSPSSPPSILLSPLDCGSSSNAYPFNSLSTDVPVMTGSKLLLQKSVSIERETMQQLKVRLFSHVESIDPDMLALAESCIRPSLSGSTVTASHDPELGTCLSIVDDNISEENMSPEDYSLHLTPPQSKTIDLSSSVDEPPFLDLYECQQPLDLSCSGGMHYNFPGAAIEDIEGDIIEPYDEFKQEGKNVLDAEQVDIVKHSKISISAEQVASNCSERKMEINEMSDTNIETKQMMDMKEENELSEVPSLKEIYNDLLLEAEDIDYGVGNEISCRKVAFDGDTLPETQEYCTYATLTTPPKDKSEWGHHFDHECDGQLCSLCGMFWKHIKSRNQEDETDTDSVDMDLASMCSSNTDTATENEAVIHPSDSELEEQGNHVLQERVANDQNCPEAHCAFPDITHIRIRKSKPQTIGNQPHSLPVKRKRAATQRKKSLKRTETVFLDGRITDKTVDMSSELGSNISCAKMNSVAHWANYWPLMMMMSHFGQFMNSKAGSHKNIKFGCTFPPELEGMPPYYLPLNCYGIQSLNLKPEPSKSVSSSSIIDSVVQTP